MKRSLICMAVCLGLAAGHVHAQDAPRRALAQELTNLMNTRETTEQKLAMVKQVVQMQMGRMAKAMGQAGLSEDMSAQADAIMAQELTWDKLKDGFIAIYADTFTEEELKGLIAFLKSPVGLAFIKKDPEVTKRSTDLLQATVLQIMMKIQAAMKTPAPAPAPQKGK
jgi:hypothetical protein